VREPYLKDLLCGRDGLRVPLPDLLHLLHALQEDLVLALLVAVALVLALPGQVETLPAARVERDEELGAEVARAQRQARFHHLLLRRQVLPRRRHCDCAVCPLNPQLASVDGGELRNRLPPCSAMASPELVSLAFRRATHIIPALMPS
jgi:hypothetical protein